MKRKMPEPNYKLLLNSAIIALQDTYSRYKKAIIKNLNFTWINDDGDYAFLDGVEERQKNIDELGKEVIRLKFKVDEIKGLLEEDKKIWKN